MPVKIASVNKDSPLFHSVSAGETLCALNGHEINDVLDYMYHGAAKRLTVTVMGADGARRDICVAKPEYEDIGLEFGTFLMDRQRACSNRCIFCFVDQLPRGMRSTLYFKDDDARMSFLRGNYITLTNLSERDIMRMTDMRISPVNISVHATNPELRARIMGNPRAGGGYAVMERFSAAGIDMNCQIVLMPGINDGDELGRTMRDLAALSGVRSVSVVPVGLTKHREGLYPLSPFTPSGARAAVSQVDSAGDMLLQSRGTRLFFPADELFLKAGMPIPPADYYEDFPQLENGIGLMALFAEQLGDELPRLKASGRTRRVAVLTGVAAHGYIERLALQVRDAVSGLEHRVIAAENRFFGQNIDVAGLLCGCDLLYAYKNAGFSADELIIPQCALNFDGDRFLDDMTLDEFERECGCPVRACAVDGGEFARALAGALEQAKE